MNKKLLAIILAVILLISVPLGVRAVIKALQPEVVSGGYEQKIVNRINLSLQNTEFTLKKTVALEQSFELPLHFQAEKTEPDLYAVIDSVLIEGISYDSVTFSAGKENGDAVNPNGAVLYESEVNWDIQLLFSPMQSGTYTADFIVNYTSGLTKETADSHQLRIPIQIYVVD